MSVRFVIGRAGTGKTYHCVEKIRAALLADAVAGPRLVFLVPEQAGLQMERAIIDPAGGVAGAHRADVVSFQRLAVRVLADARGVERVALTEPARAMVIRRLLTARRGVEVLLAHGTRAQRHDARGWVGRSAEPQHF